MAKKIATHPPRIDPLRLGELAAGNADELRPQGRYEGLRFQGIDLSGRDLDGIELSECALDDVQAHATGFRAATFSEVEFSRFNAPVLAAPRSRWRDVTMDGSRVGSAELYESYINSARFSGSKLGFVNASGAQFLDVAFGGCTMVCVPPMTRPRASPTAAGSGSLRCACRSSWRGRVSHRAVAARTS